MSNFDSHADLTVPDINTGIQTLLSLKPFDSTNFEVTFASADSAVDETNIKFYCNKIVLPTPSLQVERHPATKRHFVKGYDHPTDVTISWYEDKDLSVWRWHDMWLQCFYNYNASAFRTGKTFKIKKGAEEIINAKKRNATVRFYTQQTEPIVRSNNETTGQVAGRNRNREDLNAYATENFGSTYDEYGPMIKNIYLHTFHLIGLIPKQNYSLIADWNETNNGMVDIDYTIDRIFYNREVSSIDGKQFSSAAREDEDIFKYGPNYGYENKTQN